jgi:branched-chain amino acid transport system substrate-binding protein
VWIASGSDDHVLRLNPANGRLEAAVAIAAVPQTRVASPYAITVGDGAVWVTDALADTVSRIDPALNAVVATIKVGRRPTRIAVGEGAVWVLNAGDGTVTRIDPERNAATATIRVGKDLTGITAGLGGVWVTVGGGPARGRRSPPPGQLTAVTAPGCSSIQQGSHGSDLLITSDLPTYNPGPRPDLSIADMRAAIRSVLEQHRFRAGGYRIGYQACDDSRPNEGADPDLCASNARAYALNPRLVGVIGAYNSFCSGIELPTLNAAPAGPVAMISPSNTYVGLTQSGPATAADEPDRYYPTGARNFAHVTASDDFQSAGIDLFLKRIGRRRLYLLDDGQGTGYAGAVYARQAAAETGITIAGSASWNPDATSYAALAQQIAHTHADAVLLSGCICSNGLKLVTDLRRILGRAVTLVGTDNFASGTGFIHTHAFDGLFSSLAGVPAVALPPAGKRFLAKLFPGRPLSDIGPPAAYAAEATEILLEAIAKSDGTRASITRRLLATNLRDGVIGRVSFTAKGDPRPAPITIYRVDSRTPVEPHQLGQGEVFEQVVDPPSG